MTGRAASGTPPAPFSLARLRWGYQTGLWQPRQPAFWLFALCLLLGGLFFLLLQVVSLATAPAGFVLSWLLLALFAIPVVVVLRRLDLYEREPTSLMFGAFLWGAMVATLFSIVASLPWDGVIARVFDPEFAAAWTPAITAPVIEELYKFLGVVMIYLIARSEVDDLMDGFVYGAMVGLGFTVVEDIGYFIGVFGGGIVDVLVGFYFRTLAGGIFGHVLFTGLSGIGLAYFVSRRGEVSTARRATVAVGLLLLAMVAHFIWNSPFLSTLEGADAFVQIWIYHAVKSVPFLVLLVLAVRLARRRERRWLATAVKGEVGRPGLVAEEHALLTDPARRRDAERRLRAGAGPDAARLFRDLQREQVNLAMVRTRVRDDLHPDLVRQRAICRGLRDRLLAMPGAAEALGLSEGTLARLRALPPEFAIVPGWAPNTSAPADGLDAWPVPDPSRPRIARLEPGLPLLAVERAGDWARVVASNGWSGWVDARRLAVGAPTATAPVVGPSREASRPVDAPGSGGYAMPGPAPGADWHPVGTWTVLGSAVPSLPVGSVVTVGLAAGRLALLDPSGLARLVLALDRTSIRDDGRRAEVLDAGQPIAMLEARGWHDARVLAAEVAARKERT